MQGRKARDFAKRMLVRLFHGGQRLGIDILPRHFYSEIPDIRRLAATRGWREPYSMIGVAGAPIEGQMAFVSRTMEEPIRRHLQGKDVHALACEANGEPGYGSVEAAFLYGFIRHHAPRRIIQVGCGVSTSVCLQAIEDGSLNTIVTCIEPYPTEFLRKQAEAGNIELLAVPVESLEPNFASVLESGDLFFVDSTHTLGPAGEVSRIVLEVLPRLGDKVFVHFHDITFPYDYQGDILSGALFHWHESTLVHGLLVHSSRFGIRASLSMLHHAVPEFLLDMFPGYRPRRCEDGVTLEEGDFPSSLFLQTHGSTSEHTA